MTARYVVCLYLDANPNARVERSIRRDSDERAVIYAQTWLHRNRLSGLAYGLAFDRWEVMQSAIGDDLVRVATGVDEVAVPTPAERAARKQVRASRLKITGSVTSLRASKIKLRRSTPARPMSRLAQAVALARQKVAQDGNIPTVGSNPNSKKQDRHVDWL
jgi:hypothetical protein